MQRNYLSVLFLVTVVGVLTYSLLAFTVLGDHNPNKKPGSCTSDLCGGSIPASGGCYCDEYSITTAHDNCDNIQTVCPIVWASAKGTGTGGETGTTPSKPADAGCDYTSTWYGDDGYCDDSQDKCKPEYYKSGSKSACKECSFTHTQSAFISSQQKHCLSSPSSQTLVNKPNLKITLKVNPYQPQVIANNKVITNISVEVLIENDGGAEADFTAVSGGSSTIWTISSLDGFLSNQSIIIKSDMVDSRKLPAGGKIQAIVGFWFERVGPILISASVDPDNKVDESNEADNKVDQLITVTKLTEQKFNLCIPEKLGGLTFFKCVS